MQININAVKYGLDNITHYLSFLTTTGYSGVSIQIPPSNRNILL